MPPTSTPTPNIRVSGGGGGVGAWGVGVEVCHMNSSINLLLYNFLKINLASVRIILCFVGLM